MPTNKSIVELEEITKILDAAETLFKKYGIRSVTMADIARELGISKKTLYLHIDNKQDLVMKIMQRDIEKDQATCQQIIEKATNALDELLQISVYVQQQIQDINPSLIYDLQKYHRPVWKLMDNFHQEYILTTTENNLKKGVEEGLYREDLNIKVMSKIYVSLMPIVCDDQIFPMKVYSTSQIHKEFIKYHIHGIVSEKGRKMLKKLLADNKLNSIIL